MTNVCTTCSVTQLLVYQSWMCRNHMAKSFVLEKRQLSMSIRSYKQQYPSTIQIEFTNQFFGLWVRVGSRLVALFTVHSINHIKVSRNKHTWGEQLAATPDAINRTRQAAKLAFSGNSDTYSCIHHPWRFWPSSLVS